MTHQEAFDALWLLNHGNIGNITAARTATAVLSPVLAGDAANATGYDIVDVAYLVDYARTTFGF